VTPWRNGGGVTREVARHPETGDGGGDDFDWRLSIAEVAAGGPFSRFPDVDRTIVLLDGGAMRLDIDGVVHDLGRYDVLAFDGAAATICELPAGPTRDLNVMTRRGRSASAVEVVELAESESVTVPGAAPSLVLAVVGAITVHPARAGTRTLGPLDAFVWREPTPLELRGPGIVVVVQLTDLTRA
jgi:environmental stress-induced protein Ves